MSFGSRPSACAISATKDWTANAFGIFETDRNQPIRVCAAHSPSSHRMFWMSNGTSTRPIPCSIMNWYLGSGPKVEAMVGATLR